MPKAKTKTAVPTKEFGEVAVGETIRIGGEWRRVTAIDSHDLDAYIVLYVVRDGHGESKWVRNRWDIVGVQPDA